VFGVPVALSGNHRVIDLFTCLQRWVRTRKQKRMDSRGTQCLQRLLLGSGRSVAWWRIWSQCTINASSSSQASKSFQCGNVCEPRKQNTSRRLARDNMDWPKLKRLRFRHPLTLERIQADLETFAISYGIRTHIDRMAASSCVDNEPDES
jgi:hypothetical protein